MGGGIFSMHFIGMLAFGMDMPMAYDPGLTLVSLLLAIGFTGAGLVLVSWRGAAPVPLTAAAVMMGLGVASMHYTGMAAMRMRSEEHTYELQSLMRISYAVFCLKKKKN